MPAARQEETPSLKRIDAGAGLRMQFSKPVAFGLGPRLGMGVETPCS